MTDQSSKPIERALISVSDKKDLEALGRFLAENGVEILSTGGSAAALTKAGVPVKEVGEHTGFPEIMDGRVKTLHPLVHGGILGRRGTDDRDCHRTGVSASRSGSVAVARWPHGED